MATSKRQWWTSGTREIEKGPWEQRFAAWLRGRGGDEGRNAEKLKHSAEKSQQSEKQ